LASSCTKEIESTEVANLDIMEIPMGFPNIEHPEGNEYSVERWELGKKLFYDPILSKDGMISCDSCHEMQILVPIQEHNEFNNNIVLIADTLSKSSEYVQMAQLAYNQKPNAFVITRALSLFERSLISGQSAYDLEMNYGIETSMSESAIRGMKLFESERTGKI